MAETSPAKRKVNRELILRALTDRTFRKLLQADPEKALGKKLTAQNRREVEQVLTSVRGLESQIRQLADHLLCANGGPCGIA
jgi:hypothetical protein